MTASQTDDRVVQLVKSWHAQFLQLQSLTKAHIVMCINDEDINIPPLLSLHTLSSEQAEYCLKYLL